MRSILTALAVGTLALSSPATAQENDLEKPHEIVGKYLDEKGVAKEEFRISHYFYKDPDGFLHYNRSYDFEGKEFIEQYALTNELRLNEEGVFRFLFVYPSAFFLGGTWYNDPSKDGFNGNEVVLEDETVKEQEPKLERKVKCDGKEGLCI